MRLLATCLYHYLYIHYWKLSLCVRVVPICFQLLFVSLYIQYVDYVIARSRLSTRKIERNFFTGMKEKFSDMYFLKTSLIFVKWTFNTPLSISPPINSKHHTSLSPSLSLSSPFLYFFTLCDTHNPIYNRSRALFCYERRKTGKSNALMERCLFFLRYLY